MDDHYWLELAREVAKSATCLRRDVGAVIVEAEELFHLTAVNGTPLCETEGCLRSSALSGRDLHRCRGAHSEVRAILNLARTGLHKNNKFVLYITHAPCTHCAPVIVEAGIKEVVYEEHYRDFELANKILTQAGVKVRRVKKSGR